MTYFPNTQTLEKEYTSSATDDPIVLATATQQIQITEASAHVDQGVTVNGVGFRLGLGTPGTPTGAGVVLSHPGLMPGQSVSRGNGSGVIAVGDLNEDLRYTGEVPTGGAIRIMVSYVMVEQT